MSDDEDLAPNWRAAKAADGKEYYFNEVTGETSWTKPAPPPQRVEPLVSDGADVGAGNGVGNDVAARDMPGSLAPRAGAADSPDRFGSPSAPSGSSPGSGPLGPFMPKLVILLAASFVVMLQAAIEDGKEECITSQEATSGGNCTPHNKSLVSYAVAVGTVSLIVLLGVLACARLRPELVGEKKFAMPRGKEAKPIHLLSGFLLLWCACASVASPPPLSQTARRAHSPLPSLPSQPAHPLRTPLPPRPPPPLAAAPFPARSPPTPHVCLCADCARSAAASARPATHPRHAHDPPRTRPLLPLPPPPAQVGDRLRHPHLPRAV